MRSTGDAGGQRVQVADEVVGDRLLAEPAQRRRRRERDEVAERREEGDDARDDVERGLGVRAGLDHESAAEQHDEGHRRAGPSRARRSTAASARRRPALAPPGRTPSAAAPSMTKK